MKGIAHFVTGIAVATFFPEVVHLAAEGSLLPVLGGIAGILPDTIDFKFVRYFITYDEEIDPGPEPDAREIAARLAAAMRRAYDGERPQRVMLHTVRLGPDRWQQYAVRFDPAHDEVAVRIGPVVSTGQVPLPQPDRFSGTCQVSPETSGTCQVSPTQEWGDVRNQVFQKKPGFVSPTEAQVDVGLPLAPTYDDEIKIDIFSGPSLTFERRGDRLHVDFLDWHRRWSHSLTLAAALGLVAAGGAALIEFLTRGAQPRTPLWAGLVVGLAFAAHVLEDQLGHMGSNLLYPFTKGRTRGLGLFRSGDALPNFLTVWTAAALILFNLDRFSGQPRFDPRWFLGLAVALPAVALIGLSAWRRGRAQPEPREAAVGQVSIPAEALQQADILSEMEEVELA